MNHDYAHCLDFTKDCPKSCFRAELVRDLEKHPGPGPVGWMHLKGVECPKKDENRTD